MMMAASRNGRNQDNGNGSVTMETSAKLDKLASALSKAQTRIIGAVKDSSNPFYKSKYADLATVWDAVRGPLTDNGLALSQFPTAMPDGSPGLTTVLLHSSGQWMRSAYPVNAKENSPQAIGSALTYARRYAMAAVTGCPQIDDDAESAMARMVHTPQPDTSFVDKARIAKAVAVYDAITAKDIDEDALCLEVFDMHTELMREPDLYSAVADELANSKRIAKQAWKDAVKRGKELAHQPANLKRA
jgi:hypothetical protein